MILLIFAKLKDADVAFFVIFAVVVALIIGAYFLAPIINRKKYAEQRTNLREREKTFYTNLENNTPENKEENNNQEK